MKKIYASLETGFVNACYEEYFEFDDDVTDEEIDNEVNDWAESILGEMSFGWEVVEE